MGGRGSGDAKTIISPNTSFGDIIITTNIIPNDKKIPHKYILFMYWSQQKYYMNMPRAYIYSHHKL